MRNAYSSSLSYFLAARCGSSPITRASTLSVTGRMLCVMSLAFFQKSESFAGCQLLRSKTFSRRFQMMPPILKLVTDGHV